MDRLSGVPVCLEMQWEEGLEAGEIFLLSFLSVTYVTADFREIFIIFLSDNKKNTIAFNTLL